MTMHNLRYFTLALILLLPGGVTAEPGEAPGLLKPAELAAKKVSQLTYYYCPRTTQCTIRCAAGDGHVNIDYGNVRRLEIGTAAQEFLVGIHYADAVGKSHVSTAFLPLPSSCVLDDLVMDTILPVVDGNVVEPVEDQEVVFDVQPDS